MKALTMIKKMKIILKALQEQAKREEWTPGRRFSYNNHGPDGPGTRGGDEFEILATSSKWIHVKWEDGEKEFYNYKEVELWRFTPLEK